MPLIDLKTNLKDLKYGKDQYRGGDSGQPFIATRIPATNEPLQTTVSISGPDIVQTIGSTLLSAGTGAIIGGIGGSVLGATGTGALIGSAVGLGIGIAGNAAQGNSISIELPSAGTGGKDFIIRGNALLPSHLASDFKRLSKYFKSNDGILFTIKQNVLSRTATRPGYIGTDSFEEIAFSAGGLLNEGLYTPISTILGAVGSPFGLHVNKQGLNPFDGLGLSFTNNRYFSNIANDNLSILANNDDESIYLNRLWGLYSTKIVNEKILEGTIVNYISKNDISLDNEYILSYPGGPNAPLGIGKTKISFASSNYGEGAALKTYTDNKDINSKLPFNKSSNTSGDRSNWATLSNKDIAELAKETSRPETTYPITVIDFRKKLKESIAGSSQILADNIVTDSLDYEDGSLTLENRTNLGNPGNSIFKRTVNYTNGYSSIDKSFGAASPVSYDKINALPIYRHQVSKPGQSDPIDYPDLVNFRIGVISNESISLLNDSYIDYIHFRAFLDKITDNYTADWQETKYIGRGEKFYNYMGFDRKVSLSWTMAAQSKAELIPMYKKLNYLASLCAPDYSSYGFMRGNIVKLTIGGYFYEQPGIINGFSYEMNDENDTWEIGILNSFNTASNSYMDNSVRQLPHIIRVTGFTFTPIHEFVPRKQQNLFGGISGSEPGVVSSYGKERYIALKGDSFGSSYDGSGLNNDFDSLQQDKTLYNKFKTGLDLEL